MIRNPFWELRTYDREEFTQGTLLEVDFIENVEASNDAQTIEAMTLRNRSTVEIPDDDG